MPIDPKKCCGIHSKEREDSGECCQLEDEKDRAEALTYEQSFVTSERIASGLPEYKEKQ